MALFVSVRDTGLRLTLWSGCQEVTIEFRRLERDRSNEEPAIFDVNASRCCATSVRWNLSGFSPALQLHGRRSGEHSTGDAGCWWAMPTSGYVRSLPAKPI
jgi:hypothetical protein